MGLSDSQVNAGVAIAFVDHECPDQADYCKHQQISTNQKYVGGEREGRHVFQDQPGGWKKRGANSNAMLGHQATCRVLMEKMEAGPEWRPSKTQEAAGPAGRPKTITPAQENAIAQSAMALKAKGLEPTVPGVVAQCPTASLNPCTGAPFSSKAILHVFRTRCYDTSTDAPWDHMCAKSNTALTPGMISFRVAWASRILNMIHHAGW